MKISGMNSVSAPVMGTGQQTDALSRSLQKQIEDTKKQMQELASDRNMSDEEKMKKRQELQKKITELTQQLKQHQMEQKKEARQQERKEKESSMEDMLGGRREGDAKNAPRSTGLSSGSMQAMISADSSMKQARVQGRAATEMKGRENVLEMEIKLDSARAGGEGSTKGVDAKKEQLAETRKRRMNVESAQMQTLAEANKEAESAAKEQTDADWTEEKKETAASKTELEKAGEKEQRADAGNTVENGAVQRIEGERTKKDAAETKTGQEQEDGQVLWGIQEKETERRYTHMDVRL